MIKEWDCDYGKGNMTVVICDIHSLTVNHYFLLLAMILFIVEITKWFLREKVAATKKKRSVWTKTNSNMAVVTSRTMIALPLPSIRVLPTVFILKSCCANFRFLYNIYGSLQCLFFWFMTYDYPFSILKHVLANIMTTINMEMKNVFTNCCLTSVGQYFSCSHGNKKINTIHQVKVGTEIRLLMDNRKYDISPWNCHIYDAVFHYKLLEVALCFAGTC
jgi:hypothetical protein